MFEHLSGTPGENGSGGIRCLVEIPSGTTLYSATILATFAWLRFTFGGGGGRVTLCSKWLITSNLQPVWQWMGHPAHSNFSDVAVCTKNQRLRKVQRMKLGNYSGFLCCKLVCHLVACCVLSHAAWLCHFYLMLKAPGLNRDSVTLCCFLNYLWLDLDR